MSTRAGASAQGPRSQGEQGGPRAERPASQAPRAPVKRVLLASAVGVVGLNVWTGSPVFALWVGS
ncbi:MAG TPA: hypothetical protein VGR10_07980, partial [Thermoleophilaceae bacterium]|nr:hypothetical protein [Thermoleophilaceae bacterium]